MKANSEKTKQSNKATRRVLAGVLCGASVLSLVLSLVMPPISQAIANDDQAGSTEGTVMGGGSSSESTDVDSTNNGDTENQNSDETEGDEAGDDALRAAPLSDDAEAESTAQPADDDANDEGTIALAAENESTYEINNGDELESKLLNVNLRDTNGSATFELVADIECNKEIRLDQGGEIVLNLNGHKIKCLNTGKPLFDVANGATLTIKDEIKDSAPVTETVNDVKQLTDQGQGLNPANYGKKAELNYVEGIPSNLTYYVTKSTPSGTGTIETLVRHNVDIKGAIVACDGNANQKLINLYNDNGKGGTFNLVSGVITQKQGGSVSSLVYAENGSTVNMSGGYVCGASSSGAGAGIKVSNAKGGVSTLNLTGGVIAGNSAPNGGGVYAEGSTVTIAGGVISGNSTLASGAGLGGGIMASGGKVTVSGGYITNNRMAKFCGTDGNGDHGGAGLAANYGAKVTISDGQITGNYSEEAGGGVYVTDVERNSQTSRSGMAWLNITGGIIASNVSFRSEGAGIRVGQMVDAMINGTEDSKVYITNNHCMSRFDWGGGGIFVQGNSDQGKEYTAGRLFIYNSYISANEAGGYGGGVAVCPTGKTLVTNTEGTAIFGNSSAGAESDGEDRFKSDYKHAYNSQNNTGNEAKPHLSGGGSGKNQDKDAYRSKVFRDRGHADFFLAAAAGHQEPLAAVIGKMLGDGDAKYSGSKERSDTKELSEPIDIPANGGVKIYRSVGLTSAVQVGSDEANNAQKAARTFITGNYSWDHGGGIMSNGDLYLGVPADTYVYPSLKLKATKKLAGRELKAGDFTFTVYRKDSSDPIARGVFTPDACTEVGTASNDASGIIKFDLGEQFTANGTTGTITYYLVENAGNDPDITYDPAVYEITVELAEGTKDVLMSVPIRDNATEAKQLTIHNYTIKKLSCTKHSGDSTNSLGDLQKDEQGYYSIDGPDGGKTFTNTYTSYASSGFWTPKATKVVEGGEMKEFTLQLATDDGFQDIIRETKTTGDKKKQTLSFLDGSGKGIVYSLSDITKNPNVKGDPTGRGASKTFTYYVREKQPTTSFTNYKYDESVYKITVTATDQSDKTIKCDVTYTQIVDAKGKPIPENEQSAVPYVPDRDEATGKEQSVPVFTNTYSTSLPLSGMSGVTLTYLAGAAVLCAAAAWMHIRRKANAKGGEHRE